MSLVIVAGLIVVTVIQGYFIHGISERRADELENSRYYNNYRDKACVLFVVVCAEVVTVVITANPNTGLDLPVWVTVIAATAAVVNNCYLTYCVYRHCKRLVKSPRSYSDKTERQRRKAFTVS